MWLQAIFTRDDLAVLLGQFLPAQFRVGPPGSKRAIYLGRPTELELVKDEGLRLRTRAKIRWDVMGLEVPVTIKSVAVMLRPVIQRKNRKDQLVLRAAMEDVDLSGIPAFVDRSIVGVVNKQLDDNAEAVAWDFIKTLTFHIRLPDLVQPVESFDLIARWGEVKVTPKAMTLAVAFKTRTHRAARDADAA